MDALRKLLIEQMETIDSLKRVIVNFKKLAKANITRSKTQGRLENLQELWASCRELHVKLLQTATSEEQKTLSYFLNAEFLVAEEIYHDAADLLRETISRLTVVSPPALESSTDSSVRDGSNNNNHFQLPRISLPRFTGKFSDWESFKNIFESLVANNETLSNTQKFHYLKASVIGDAALIIQNLRISEENYASAWQLLVDEYDDKLTLIHTHLHAFMSSPVMKHESVVELRKLRDTVAASLAALSNLKRPVDKWDDILVYIITNKFSSKTRSEWNLKRSAMESIPSYKDIHEFLTLRIRGLSDFADISKENIHSRPDKPKSSVNNVAMVKCICCSGNHSVARCEEFRKRSAVQRGEIARKHRVCFNCLRSGHISPKCTSKLRCAHCHRSHNTLLHLSQNQASDIAENTDRSNVETREKSEASLAHENAAVASVQTCEPPNVATPTVLLATAWVDIHTTEGRRFKVRALLDQGSNFSFISEALCQTMRAKRQKADLQIKGFGEMLTGSAKSRVSLRLTSCDKTDPAFPLTAYVFQKITSYAASRIQPVEAWPHLRGLSLADPDPSSKHQIHMLIGADVYGSLLMRDLRQGPIGTPTAQLTALGWIISGPAGKGKLASIEAAVLNCVLEQNVDSLLQKYWVDEEISQSAPLTEEEEKCERHFVQTHGRSSDGRYVVRLPFKSDPPIEIGESLSIARSLYNRLEKGLKTKSELRSQYSEFLAEYESLGHMTRVHESENSNSLSVYIPHHPVVREASSTTKLRVVFNASCKTRNGTTLNDHLLTGPKLQQDLPAVLARWRKWRHVYTADIAKMFRQIRVHPEDVDFQRILWRPTENANVLHFRLLTVTYGLAPAPYLAMRVLKQLALDEGANYPAAVSILNESIYVDDTLFGSDDIQSLINTRVQLTSLMEKGGFQLRKWASNTIELLNDLSTDKLEDTDHLILEDESLKVLGLSWIPSEDSFRLVVRSTVPVAPTKRSILSFVARLYDPLGWAAPVLIVAKIVLQELWLLRCDWDSPLPDEMIERWTNFASEFCKLEEVRIPRWTGQNPDNLAIEIHGFADASNRAFAAVVYLRVFRTLSEYEISLITAKTKVAPVKTVSIPRLELNAVVLLSRLIKWTINSLNLLHVPLHCWTDSTIALAWLRQHPSKWTTYVANRVSEAQNNLPSARWKHVPSRDNPADCASRGLTASELLSHPLWWSGPSWLRKPSTAWPTQDFPVPITADTAQKISNETRKTAVLHAEGSEEWELMYKFSSWTKLVRVTAYIRRYISLSVRKGNKDRTTSSLSADELNQAEMFWLSYVQRRAFDVEIKALSKDNPIGKKSSLRTLSPFLDENSLLRLGGRLKNAALAYDEQHPVIVPKGRIASLLIDNIHKRTLHGGVQLVLCTLRQRFWVLGGRNAVKNCIRQCMVCTRHSARVSNQLMGDLPSPRVNPSSPFTHTGVDYAGPFLITPFIGRGQKARKNWIALFICLVTKAIHLELVEDYSSAGFLSAFRRFVGRRGLPNRLYSDNGTNFRGANKELKNAFEALIKDSSLQAHLANDRIEWSFIPSGAPHFGGLWEAGVKSLKSHLKRVVGSRTLSRAEFVTLLCQIEACLNSRPIAALSDDPSDLSALTPGHFLIGRPMIAVPEESVLAINTNRLSRWQLVHSIMEQIWRAWSLDYLHSLQQRRKWTEKSSCFRVGELALLKNPLLPPSKWDLVRVTQIHPGSDGLVRVVTVRTAHSVLKRPITSLCRLPVNCV